MTPSGEKMFALRHAPPGARIKLGVGVAVRDGEGRLLLEKRSDCGMWGFPGGRVEPGETVEQAACREVLEETGLTIRIERLIGVYSDPAERMVVYPDNGDVRQLVDIFFEASIVSGELRLSHESEALRFFQPCDLPGLDLVRPAIRPLEHYLQGATGIIA